PLFIVADHFGNANLVDQPIEDAVVFDAASAATELERGFPLARALIVADNALVSVRVRPVGFRVQLPVDIAADDKAIIRRRYLLDNSGRAASRSAPSGFLRVSLSPERLPPPFPSQV